MLFVQALPVYGFIVGVAVRSFMAAVIPQAQASSASRFTEGPGTVQIER